MDDVVTCSIDESLHCCIMLCVKDDGIPVLWMWLRRCCVVELFVRIRVVVVVILVFDVASFP